MATRLLRTDRIANIVDFGALENDETAAGIAANANAFRLAFFSGALRIAIPAGNWYFEEILYLGQEWLPVGVEIFGQGRFGQTNLFYRPDDSSIAAFTFAPVNPSPPALLARSTIRDLRLEGPVLNGVNTPPESIGISMDQSLYNYVRDVAIWDFRIGIQFNAGVTTYSGYNVVERFEVNNCETGVFVGNHTNACALKDGRIYHSVVIYDGAGPGAAREEGIGLDIPGTLAGSLPQGAQGFVLSDVAIEDSPLCVNVAASVGISVQGGYIEPGATVEGGVRRRSVQVDDLTMELTFAGTLFSEPGVPMGEWDWTPTYVDLPPETRGVVDVAQAPPSGNSYNVNAYGGAISGTTAAKSNLLKNANMSRGAMFWTSSPAIGAPLVTPNQTPYVTGGASTSVAVTTDVAAHIYQDFIVDSGVRTVTVGVRYQILNAGVNAFRVDLWEPSTNTRLGFFSDVGPGPTGWRVRSLTGRFDGLAGGVTGPRTLRVRVFPYRGDGFTIAGQEVLIDSVWLVEGEYAATYRAYTDDTELLIADDREQFFSGATNAPVGPVAVGPTNVPSNAIGMVVEMWVQGSDATATPTILRVNDLSGTLTTRDVHAFVSNRPTLIDYTLPFTPTPGAPPQWSILGASSSNTVNYSVRLKQWILRP